jgi:hypothetical protein
VKLNMKRVKFNIGYTSTIQRQSGVWELFDKYFQTTSWRQWQ